MHGGYAIWLHSRQKTQKIPVSYTHLDVYKRQGKTQPGCLAENDFKYKS